jgi:tRNA (guanine-N7-)-methyltransferase
MHQKQPPAKIAVLLFAAAGSAPFALRLATAKNALKTILIIDLLSSNSSDTIPSKLELVPADCFGPLDLSTVYGRNSPLEVDLGCGDGALLVKLAGENRYRNYLGIERLPGRVRTACRKIEQAGLTNARILRFEISYAVERLLPPSSVAAFHIMFPDPWPKRRHASRRLVSERFLTVLHTALRVDGAVRIATDEAEYFRQITRLVSRSSLFAITDDPPLATGASKFEKRFLQRGMTIHRLSLRKVSPLT